MKKAKYFRMVFVAGAYRPVKTEGWKQTVQDSAGHVYTLCYHRADRNLWHCTEITTGCSVCVGYNRQNAFETSLLYVERLHKILNQPHLIEYKEQISRAYDEEAQK